MLPRILMFYALFVVVLLQGSTCIMAQCLSNVTHFSGTETVGCVDVMVTSNGAAGGFALCGASPYFIGQNNEGSYTFTFSQPLSSAYFLQMVAVKIGG